ncbi:MAG: glycosyltransferase N-terminal domain-containing protein [Saprospiraceae bacterium]
MKVFSFFSPKVKKLDKGQKETLIWLTTFKNQHPEKKSVWMHCSSLGEFEQGRMVLEGIKRSHPNVIIYLSFFSPSGYEIRKKDPIADFVFYLPLDTPLNAKMVATKLKPDLFILVKYDFWWNIIKTLQKQGTFIYVVAAQFKPNRYYYCPPFLPLMKKWAGIFTISDSSRLLLQKKGFQQVFHVGDPRVDRVNQIKNNPINIPQPLVSFCLSNHKLIVYGSVWLQDMIIIKETIQTRTDWTHLVVPHDISKDNVNKICQHLPKEHTLYSSGTFDKNVVVIDHIGLLSGLYQYAFMAYIGGGFSLGIHNILEPAIFGIPVAFGPKYKSFSEAVELIRLQCAFSVTSSDQFKQFLNVIYYDKIKYESISNAIGKYFDDHLGASDKIIDHLKQENILV